MSKQNNKASKKVFTVYLAGDLWNHKDLVGNAILADYINKVSRGRYQCVLPQDLEEPVHRTVDIRNVDLKHVLTSDMAIFNFDGSYLDSGTVVEFIYAKMLDIPCVILRTDFRASGEGSKDQDPWNLMASNWPRAKVLCLHGMAEYQKVRKTGPIAKTLKLLYTSLASNLIEKLDEARAEKPLITDPSRMAAIYDWAVNCPGAGYSELFGDTPIETILKDKSKKGLLA